jgi:acyl-CoA thioester hydrolase
MNTANALEHSIELVPAFFDIDPMEVVWHGHYVKYLELARSALMQARGYGYQAMRESGYAWPIVELKLKYVRPARLGIPVLVTARIVEWENRLRIDYLIVEAASGQKLTTAQTTQVAVEIATGSLQFVSPRILLDRLGVSAA